MQLLLFIFLLFRLSASSPITTKPQRHILENRNKQEKRQDEFFSVLGVAGFEENAVHPRLEIRQLEKDEDQWNVYLLGLRRFQSIAQNDKLSYYQVAGMCHVPSQLHISALKINLSCDGPHGVLTSTVHFILELAADLVLYRNTWPPWYLAPY